MKKNKYRYNSKERKNWIVVHNGETVISMRNLTHRYAMATMEAYLTDILKLSEREKAAYFLSEDLF